jgi:uncharacterized protein (DUF885 family)
MYRFLVGPATAVRAALASLVAALMVTAAPAAAQPRTDARLNALLVDYERLDRQADPITSGGEGDRDALSRLPDVTPTAQAATRAALVSLASRLGAIAPRRLSADAQLNRALLLQLVGQRIEGLEFDESRAPFGNSGGFFGTGDYLARATPVRSAADAEAWIARLQALPSYLDANVANARRGVSTGFTQPRIVVDRALELARAQRASAAATLLLPFEQLSGAIAAAAQEQYRARARAIIADAILPAHDRVIAFLQTEYLPAARPALAARSLPNGEAYYRYLARQHTTTAMTPDEIHALGQSEVRRIRAEMDAVMRESGFQGSFAQFQHFLRTDPRFYAQTPEDLMEKAAEIAKRADDQLPRLFATLPRLPYGVREIPREEAEGSTTAYYQQGSPALGVAGGYMVNTLRLDQRPLYELPALTLHEAVPGHHLQISLAQEAGELPYFRRTNYITAFGEGWGLYAESLGQEMGIYRTPYERFGRLSYEMWRACRLVADTGLHWLGWSIEQARACFAENSALSPHNIQTELERYIATPGQALGYKIGELRLQALRREAQAALGERFDLRFFHDAVLGAGSVPLDVLETRVRAWVAGQR